MALRAPYLALGRSGAPRAIASREAREARDPRTARVEAVLLLADEPLNTRKISQLANLADGTEARTLIRRLNELFDREGTAFRAEEVAGGFQLLTRRKFAGWLRRLVRTHVEARLSAPALETLAVAAYRQPVTRGEVEAIRGVQCDEMLRQLMERDLLKIVGRSEDLGRPFLYGTTRRFLQFFGLRHLDELPRAAELRAGNRADDTTHSDANPNNVLQEEPEVKIAADTELAREEALMRRHLARVDEVRAEDEDEDEDDDVEDDDDDDDDEDDEEDEDDDDVEDDDFDDDWEEVDDEDEDEEDEEDWDDDEDDDEDDDDFDDDDEEEEEEADDEE